MLSASRRALQLLASSIPVRKMGDTASKVISAEESLPGRTEPITVAGKTARAPSMRAEPTHCALPEEAARDLGRVLGRSLRVREAAPPPPPHTREGRELSGVVSCRRASLCLSLSVKESRPAALYLWLGRVRWEPSLSLPSKPGLLERQAVPVPGSAGGRPNVADLGVEVEF